MKKFRERAKEILEGRNNPGTNDIITASNRIFDELSPGSTLNNAVKQFGSSKTKKLYDKAVDAVDDFKESLIKDWNDTGWGK